jgi:ABC-2 type transport system ATP-binding protein
MSETTLGAPSAAVDEGQAAATVRDLRVSYGAQTVLDGLHWQLATGQVVGLLGRNGAGKTTLLETMLGLRESDRGDVRLFGRALGEIDDATRARVGYVPQKPDLFGWLTATQLLAYFRSFYPRWNEAKVESLLQRWAIARDKPIARLSGGEQQRLSIIRALAHEPQLLVLDEPVASLDPAGRRDFLRELVEQVLDRGTTIVFSTHILSDLERVAFNVAFLARGRIALQAPLEQLKEEVRRVVGPPTALEQLERGTPLEWLGGTRAAGGSGLEQRLARAPRAFWREREGAVGATFETITFEDLYLELT